MKVAVNELPYRLDWDVVLPSFLDELDHPWLQRLIERASAVEGLRAGDLVPHLLAPLAIEAPPAKHKLAAYMLFKSLKSRVQASAPPKDVRERVWIEAGRDALSAPLDRDAALARAGDALSITREEVMASLFADLPAERVVQALAADELPSPGALAARANLHLAQSFVSRASRMVLDVKGASRNLLRGAKAKGLLCTIRGPGDGSAALLELSGPMSLFKRTRLYGSALASLLPALVWCDRWVLEAECTVGGRSLTFRLSTGAPILPSAAPKRFDSRVEERFAKDFDKLFAEHAADPSCAPWRLVREPRPIESGDTLLFPDFAIERAGGEEPAFVELVGFWTPRYLEEKLERYRRARIKHLVLCVDEDLACAESSFPPDAHIVRFRKKVDVVDVLAAIA